MAVPPVPTSQWAVGSTRDYVSSCGIAFVPVVYQVVGYGRGDGRHIGSSQAGAA